MKTSLVMIAVLTLFSLLASSIILAQPFGKCDPIGSSAPPLARVDIEGAHIVSEGAYFRFWILNNNSFPIQVTVNTPEYTNDYMTVPSYGSIDYNVIAPKISVAYEQVTYKFWLTSSQNGSEVDFTVIVLNSSFVQIFDWFVPTLATVVAIVIVLVAIVIVRRKRGRKKT